VFESIVNKAQLAKATTISLLIELRQRKSEQHAINVKKAIPIHNDAKEGINEIVELLIAKGADVNAKGDAVGLTPLDAAIRGKQPETSDLLRKHGGKTGAELLAEGK